MDKQTIAFFKKPTRSFKKMASETIKKIKLSVLIGLAFGVIAQVQAYDIDPVTKKIQWKYYNGDTSVNNNIHDAVNNNGTRYGITYSPTGLIYPIGLLPSGVYASNFSTTPPLHSALGTLSVDLDSKLAFTLKENRNINLSNIVLSGSDQTNLKIAHDTQAEVWLTFYSEGAGFENSLGFFTYDPASPPIRNADGSNNLKTEQIIYPRASQSTPLLPAGFQGSTVYLGKFDGGAKGIGVGFFIAANGWNALGRTLADGSKVAGVNEDQGKNWIFYSLQNLNPEPESSTTSNLKQHAILLQDTLKTAGDNRQYQRLVLGFEDNRRDLGGSDNDFNDLLMVLHAAVPQDAAYKITDVITNLATLPKLSTATTGDKDGDGVNDAADEFPSDPTKAYSLWYPGSNTYGTLAYEDTWPELGDFDFNDIVVRYRSRQILNAQRQIKALEMDLQLVARGGGLENGFAISLPGITVDKINMAKTFLTAPDGNVLPASSFIKSFKGEDGGVVFEISGNVKTLMPADAASDSTNGCAIPGYYNTGKGCPIRPFLNYKLTVELLTAQATFPSPPYDPFIFRSNANGSGTIEVHLPNRQPTNFADLSLFHTKLDGATMQTGTNKYLNSYKSINGVPWVLDIPITWDYAYEQIVVTDAYPDMLTWINSSGVLKTNWYTTPVSANKTFRNGR